MQPQAMSSGGHERRHDLDWLRLGVTLVVFTYHVAHIFHLDPWHIKNAQTTIWMSVYVEFANAWQMPLFFLMAGAATWFALGYRTADQYLLERVKRIAVPFVFGFLVLVPPQSYLEQVSLGIYAGPYLNFYPQFFRGIPLTLSLKTFVVAHHLWFLGYLFVFSVTLLPVFLLLLTHTGRRVTAGLGRFFSLPGMIFLLAVPYSISESVLFWMEDVPRGWEEYFLFAPFFLYGFLLMADARIREAVKRHAPVALALGVPAMVAVIYMRLWGDLEPVRHDYWLHAGWRFLKGFNTLFWTFGVLGLGMRFLQRESKVLAYTNEAILPFYVLHQTVIVMIGYVVIRWPAPIVVKFVVVTLSAVAVTLGLYDLVVKRVGVLRFLFGMKPRKRKARAPARLEEPLSAGD